MDKSSEIEGEITQEVINILIELMKNVIGENGVGVILKHINIEENASGRKIVYAFAESATKILGKQGAFATLRQVGRELAKVMMSKHAKEDWEFVLRTALNDLGFAQKIDMESEEAYICNCVFYSILEKNNMKPIEHSVCWAGWGFIEGFMKALEGVKGIKWSSRDVLENRCKFDYIRA